jgi:hypothetical protein
MTVGGFYTHVLGQAIHDARLVSVILQDVIGHDLDGGVAGRRLG